MPNFWTPGAQEHFHRAVEALHSVTDTPLKEERYGVPRIGGDNQSTYILRLTDELQIADHIAFLAHSKQGAKAVSAVCVEESVDGLVFRLASNHTPSGATVSGLRVILDDLNSGILAGHRRVALSEKLFDDVLSISKRRILQRVQPPWLRLPATRGREHPLWQRLDDGLLRRFKPTLSVQSASLRTKLKELVGYLRLLQTKPQDDDLTQIMRDAVRKCAEVSYHGQGSLEKQLIICRRSFSRGWDSKVVDQVDKLARYYGLCGDLAKIALRPSYRALFQNVTLQPLEAPPGRVRLGTSRTCFVHAEAQIIFDLERNPPTQPPRAIGCSKSACFLCDMLLRTLDKYVISTAHRRLYPQWTLPEMDWMIPEQTQRFQNIVSSMTGELEALTRQHREQGLGGGRYGIESRAVLPLPSESTVSAISGPSMIQSLPIQSDQGENTLSVGSECQIDPLRESPSTPCLAPVLTPQLLPSTTLSLITLSASDLPFEESICIDTKLIQLSIDDLALTFEFLRVSAGRLSVSRVRESSASDRNIRQIDVAGIPESEMKISCLDTQQSLEFQLEHSGDLAIRVEMLWGTYPGWKTRNKAVLD